MRPPEILKKLKEMRETYREQSFSFTKEQQAEYDKVLALRRERVKSFYKNDRVSKGGLSKPNVDVT